MVFVFNIGYFPFLDGISTCGWKYSGSQVSLYLLQHTRRSDKIYKTTEYLRMKSVLDSIELRMLRRADYMRERNILGESHVYSYRTPSVSHIGWEIGWADSLLSLAFATRWNPKHPSYVSTQLFCNSIWQICCGEQTIWDVQSYWQVKSQTNK